MVVTPIDGEGRLLVSAGETWGSLGDSALEHAAVETARADARRTASARRRQSRARRGPDRALRAACAGRIQRRPVRRRSRRPCARASARPLACRVTWVDSRPNEFPRRHPRQRPRRADRDAGRKRSQRRARRLLPRHDAQPRARLRARRSDTMRGDFAFCGMIGSQTKRRTFENGLRASAACRPTSCAPDLPDRHRRDQGEGTGDDRGGGGRAAARASRTRRARRRRRTHRARLTRAAQGESMSPQGRPKGESLALEREVVL